MRLGKKMVPALVILLFLSSAAVSFTPSFQQDPESPTTPQLQQEKPPEEIHPAPANIKQKVGLLVFLGWLWLSILVLIYFLRLKIQEADRLYELEF
jgi:hypothetical protein